MTTNATTIRIDTDSYNQRRYGKPWIATVTFAADGKSEMAWGQWVGRDGDAGTLVISAAEGDIVATGQRDNRGGNSSANYHQVRGGELAALPDKATAFKLATAPKTAAAPDPYGLKGRTTADLQAMLDAVMAELNARI